MPELPEVEVTRRSVEGIEAGKVLSVQIGKPLRWPLGLAPEALVGLVAGRFTRRGKYLWLPLLEEGGSAAGGLLWHLGMSGSLAFGVSLSDRGKHDHLALVTDRGTLRLTDPRRFGAVIWSPSQGDGLAGKLLAGLGAEPFDAGFTAAAFHAALQARRCAIKLALLAGDIVVGAGNIYACEALFDAAIDPRTPCSRIGPRRAARLLEALRQVLAKAILAGGSSLRDFRDAHGSLGTYQGSARVYGRTGLACARCPGTVRRIVQGQRSTFYCPRCQRR